MTGTKFGCGVASVGLHAYEWGPVRSCQTYEDIEDAEITTIEAMGDTEIGAAVQQARVELICPMRILSVWSDHVCGFSFERERKTKCARH